MYIRYTPNPPKALRAAPAGAKKPARAAPEALRNLGKPKIPVFLMVGVNCIYVAYSSSTGWWDIEFMDIAWYMYPSHY